MTDLPSGPAGPGSTQIEVTAAEIPAAPDTSLRPPSVPVLLSLFAAAWIALAEVNRLTDDLVDARGRSRPLTDLVGFSRLADLFTWQWVDHEPFRRLSEAVRATVGDTFRWWLLVYAVVDVVAVLCLALLVDRLLRYRPQDSNPPGHAVRLLPLVMVVLRVGTDVALVALAVWPAAGVSVVVRLVAGLSWLAFVAVVAVAAHRLLWGVAGSTPAWRRQLRALLRALYAQRFSLTVVGVLAAIVSLPGGEVLDQFPDAIRAWLDDVPTGGRHALLANVALLVLAVVVLVLGRMRATRVFAAVDPQPDPSTEPPSETDPAESAWRTYGWWVIPPGGAALLALVVHVTHRGEVDLGRLAWFVLPLLALLGLSLVLRLTRGHGGPIEVPAVPPPSPDYARLVWRVGDVLTGAVLVVGGLGLVRAMTAPTLLDVRPGHTAVLVVGFAVVVLAWPATGRVLRRLHAWHAKNGTRRQVLAALLRPDDGSSLGTRPSIVLAVFAVAGLALLALYPLGWAEFLGVVGLVVVALTCLVTLAALAVLQSQSRNTLDLFALLRMRRNPVLALILAVPLVASLQSGDPEVHRVRRLSEQGAPAAAAQRPTLAAAFDTWVGTATNCRAAQRLRGHPVRPLVLVAAAGGGIRAALWTGLGLEHLERLCSSSPVFLSSGVSGGSVGLALSRQPAYLEAVRELAGPAPLAATLDGLLVRDLVAGALGVRIFDAEGDPGEGATERWLDRAGLLERSWERRAKGLDAPFLPGGGGPAGRLVLNSTSVTTACRVVVSDVDLDATPVAERPRPAPGATAEDPDCRTPRADLPAVTFDLFDTYQQCVGLLRTSSAALLSARFAYVTPSGVVSGCPGLTGQQLVDGGYAESDALGTLVDLAPALMRLIREHNAGVLAGSDAEAPLVVPTVVFLQNHFGTDVTPRPSTAQSEILVPTTARRAEKEQQQSAAFRQRLVAALADPCSVGGGCDRTSVLPAFVTVAPASEPQVSAPLGWNLSAVSVQALERAMDKQAACPAGQSTGKPAGLCDLITKLTPRPG